MLAFNLGVFFRNLKGEEVSLYARNEHCDVRFSGGVEELVEHTDLSHHLAVTLTSAELSCRIVFEEAEGEETPEHSEVDIELILKKEGNDFVLLRTAFRFEEITLKPASGGPEEEPEDGPISA